MSRKERSLPSKRVRTARSLWDGNKSMLIVMLVGACALLIAQSFGYQHTNPPAKDDMGAPAEIDVLLRRACYDCHSNETRWPWYTTIAPVSWLIERDVELGRKQLNFSEWGSYYPATRKRKLQWMGRALRKEAMPPWIYRMLHPDATLTQTDLARLQQWTESAIADQTQQNRTKQEN